MMVIAVGLSSYNIALFHLVNHAFYKGLLFLGAGAVIHAVADNQDFRKYGGLRPFLPLTYSVMLIASLSLVAFPFMTGFYSKDFILESAYGQFYFSSAVVYFIATIGAMFTTLYSVKVLYLTFLTNPNGPLVNYKQVHEGDIFMSLPLIILAIFSIFFGYVTKDIFLGLASGFFSDNSLFIHPSHEIMLDTEFAVPTLFKLLPLIFTISLCVISIVLSEFLPKMLIHFKFTRLGYNIFSFFNQRFLIELFYNKYVTGLILKLGGQTTKVIDKGSVELLGPYGLEKGLVNLSRNIASLDTGVITSYALYILVGLIFYILIPYLNLVDNSLLLLILFGLFSTLKTYKNPSIFNLNFTDSEVKQGNVIVQSGLGIDILFLYNKVNKYKNFIILFILSATLLFIIYFLLNDFSPLYCIDEETERKISVANELAKNVNSNVSNNNTNLNIQNPDLHLHNPNINVPSSIGTSIGIGGTVSSGIYALSQAKRVTAMPIGAKAGMVALGGIIGGTAFVTANYMNTYAQKSLNSSSSNSNDKNDPYSSASSILEYGDSTDSIMYFLNLNFIVSIFMLCLSLLLIYMYVKNRNKSTIINIIWILLITISSLSIYLAYNLTEDIDIISQVYQKTTGVSTTKAYDNHHSYRNEADKTVEFLTANMLFSISIFFLLYLLMVLHINTKIINNKWEFTYIKYILGEYYYSYFYKLLKLTSKSNELWMLFGWILLIIACLFSTCIAFFLINYIDIITEVYLNSKK